MAANAVLIIFYVVFFIMPLVVIFSLFAPKRLNLRTKKNQSGRYSRSNFYKLIAVIWVLLIVIGAVIVFVSVEIDDTSHENYEESVSNVEKQSDSSLEYDRGSNNIASYDESFEVNGSTLGDDPRDVEVGTFGLTLDDFDKNIEDLSKKLGIYDESEGKTTPYDISKGEFDDTFTEKYTENEGIIGVLSKSGNIKEITIIKNKVLQRGDNVDLLLSIVGASVVALDPNTDYYQNQKFFSSELQNAKDQFVAEGRGKRSGSIGNIAYAIETSEETATQVTLLPYQ